MKIANTVQIGGVTYKITAIEKKAFANYKYLTSVQIGDKVTKISEKAFKGINKKVVVNVPKKQYKKYVSLMKKGNVPSKVTYKKVK